MIKELEIYLSNLLNELGYKDEIVSILPSSKKELGDFQVNICMSLAKKYHENPVMVANKIKDNLDSRFTNVNIAGPGFINFSLSSDILLSYINNSITDFNSLIPSISKKKVVIDFGGANAAKALHVGHMRSANIGEAVRRLSKTLGYDITSDVHLGDLGRQAGMLLSEIKKRGEYLEFFDPDFNGEYPTVSYNSTDLGKLYVAANIDANDNQERMDEVRLITAEIDRGNKNYIALWKQLVDISSKSIKKVYDDLNCHFDLWEGELDSFKDVPSMLDVMNPYLYESNGAKVIDVKVETDTKEMPPLIVIKNDGATIYATRDLATIHSRVKRFNPDEIWYFTDQRQSLYFEQVFRASYKSGLVSSDTKLKHFGFGTVNGKDGKPYKTRDGGVMELGNLISLIEDNIRNKMTDSTLENKDIVVHKLAIAALKFADLMSFRETDYIFDLDKFSSFDGKTGPYVLYTLVRIKSILSKTDLTEYKITNLENNTLKDILLKVIEIPSVFEKCLNDKSLNSITDFLFDICSLFNKFYNNYHILTEEDINIKNNYISMLKLIANVISNLLNILAIDEVDKM